jgi:putative aminopeptidase FrvX
MPADQFERMRDILAAPSPVGFEAAMTHGVLEPYFRSFMPDSWTIHRYRGNGGIVLDTHPGRDDLFTVMVVGHADKIRMQVRHIGDDGKVWIDSDSFLPCCLLGHDVVLYSEDPKRPGTYRALRGGTVEAIGAIHFADARVRSGEAGIKPAQLYLELQIFGEDRRGQIERLGIRPGDPIILDRPIRPGFTPETFYGAYLDNGLGCFVAAEVARLVAERPLKNVRVLAAAAAWEEIGRMGSRVLAGVHRPDALIAVDVNHDFVAAPGVTEKRFPPLSMGKGFTLSNGAIVSEQLNSIIAAASDGAGIPWQRCVTGRDTGTDAMAGVFAGIDCAATSIGFPIRNMHTISETACTGDVLASIHGIFAALERMDGWNEGTGIRPDDLRDGHPRLDRAEKLTSVK